MKRKTITDAQYEVFRKNLKNSRKEIGMTAKDFGDCLGMTAPQIYAMEGGKRKPSAEQVNTIALIIGVTPEDLTDTPATLDKKTRKETGKRIRDRRIEVGLTAKQVAGAIGINTNVYKEMEEGETNINDWQMDIIKKLLQLDKAESKPKPNNDNKKSAPAAKKVVPNYYHLSKETKSIEEKPSPSLKIAETEIPIKTLNTLIEHVTDLNISKDEQRDIFRTLSTVRQNVLEKELFG